MQTPAVVFRAANQPTLETIPLPASLEAGELRVRIAYSGVSIGTEQSIFSGERTHNGTFPLVSGYMAAGTVEAAGGAAGDFAVGDQVVCFGPRFGAASDVNSVWGAHTGSQVVLAENCTRIPAGVDLQEAAMFVLPGVGLNAVNMAGVTMEDTVLIQGQGLIGQFCGQWCRRRGARVITIEPDPSRRELSRQLVTRDVLDPTTDDLAARLAELTNGAGPTVVVEATAAARLVDSASRWLQPNGKMIFLSWYPGHISIDFAHFHNNQITAYFPTGAGGPPATRATLAALADGSLRMAENITDVYPYTDAADGFRRLVANDRSIMAMIIDWRQA